MCCGLVKRKNDFTICTLLKLMFIQFSYLGETVLLGILVWLKGKATFHQALLSIIGRSG